MLYAVVMYLLAGLLSIYVVAFVHLIRAEMRGYAAIDWWNTHKHVLFSQGKSLLALRFIAGLFIWPERIADMIFVMIPDLYGEYELK